MAAGNIMSARSEDEVRDEPRSAAEADDWLTVVIPTRDRWAFLRTAVTAYCASSLGRRLW